MSALEVGKILEERKKLSCLESYHPDTPTVSDLCDLGRDTLLCLSFLSHTPEEKGHVLQGSCVINDRTDNKPIIDNKTNTLLVFAAHGSWVIWRSRRRAVDKPPETARVVQSDRLILLFTECDISLWLF